MLSEICIHMLFFTTLESSVVDSLITQEEEEEEASYSVKNSSMSKTHKSLNEKKTQH